MSAEAKQPYVRFYPSDWLAGTRGMRPHECGIYITLIMMMYERCEPLPENDQRLARLCNTTVKAFRSTLEMLVKDGKIIRTDAGLWNKRVQREFDFRQQKSSKAAEAAQERWKKLNKNNGPSMQTHSERNASGMPKPEARSQKPEIHSPSVSERDGVEPDIKPDFDLEFWSRKHKAAEAGIQPSLMGRMLQVMSPPEAIDALDYALTQRDPPRYIGGILKSRGPSREKLDLPLAIKRMADAGEPVQPLGNGRWKVGWDTLNERGEVVGI